MCLTAVSLRCLTADYNYWFQSLSLCLSLLLPSPLSSSISLALSFSPPIPLLPESFFLQSYWLTGHLVLANDNMEFSKRGREREKASEGWRE